MSQTELLNENEQTTMNLEALAGQAAGMEEKSDFIPPTEEEERQELDQAREEEESAQVTAQIAVMIAEQTVVSLWPMLEYDDEQRAKAAEVLAPVIAKHNGEMPPWLAAYKEEMQAAGFFALVGFQSYLTVKAHNKALAANEEGDQEEGAREASS